MSGDRRGLTLAAVLVAVMAVLVASVLVVPALLRSRRHDRIMQCADRLRELHRAQGAFRNDHPGETPLLGRGYWINLTGGEPPYIRAEAMRCPFVTDEKAPDCQYLGPSQDVGALGPDDPLGCDIPDNHGHPRQGGNVLKMSGEVVNDHAGLWSSAVQGRCRP